MNAEEIISFISNAEKKTPVKVYLRLNGMVDFGPECHVFGRVWRLECIAAASDRQCRQN